MITCAICGEKFKSMITWKHLKSHGLTTKDYKEKFGSVVTPEYRDLKSSQSQGENNGNYRNAWTQTQKEAMSQIKKGNIPWNKGSKMPKEFGDAIRQRALERYKTLKENNQEHPTKGRKHTDEAKEKIKKARANQKITKEQVEKAIQTKRDRGYDLGFFRGKKHSQDSLIKMQIAREKGLRKIKQKSHDTIIGNLTEQNITLCSDINDNVLTLSCNFCKSQFHFTKQYCRGAKLKTNMCPVCYPKSTGTSQTEQEIANWIKAQGVAVIQNDRSVIAPLELDIFLPEHKIAIEYCGLYWHSEEYKDKEYHRNKWELCRAAGVRLITIFEDEWHQKTDIVKSKLKNLLGQTNTRLSARKCQIKYIPSCDSTPFLKENHLQGAGKSTVKIGAYYNDTLIAVMTFSQRNLSRKSNSWEIDRFCVKTDFQVTGIASRLWSRFVQKYKPEMVISYSDLRWGLGEVYRNCGFDLESLTVPNYWYFMLPDTTRKHRFTLRKTAQDRQDLTEMELRISQGWSRIWDCGNAKWVYKPPTLLPILDTITTSQCS
jgi:hypothetical protein